MSRTSYSLSQGPYHVPLSFAWGLCLLFVSCACVWAIKCWWHSHSCLELWQNTLKWFCFLHALHVFQNARHCLWLYVAPQYSQLFILSIFILFSGLLFIICKISYHYVCGQSLLHFSFHIMFFSVLWTSSLSSHISTCMLFISLMILWDVSSFIFCCAISSSFIRLINCSLGCLSCSL